MRPKANAVLPLEHDQLTNCKAEHKLKRWQCLHAMLDLQPGTAMLPESLRSGCTACASSDQISLHLFQPHQADQMLDPQAGSSYVSKH
jgi:hypothetical protein